MWKRACVDIDNTLLDVNTLVKEKYHIDDVEKIYPHPRLDEKFFTSSEGIRVLSSARPIPGTLRILGKLLSIGTEIVFATSRPPQLKDITVWQLKKLGLRGRLVFTKDKRRIEADIYVEDDPQQILKLLNAGKHVLSPAWDYNSGYKHPKHVRYRRNPA